MARAGAIMFKYQHICLRGGLTVDAIEEIKAILAKVLGVPIEQIRDDASLEDLGAASIDIVEILYEIEEKFDISISIKPSEPSLQVKSETGALETTELGLMTIVELAYAVNSLVAAKRG
jgi:acyl carrier protein